MFFGPKLREQHVITFVKSILLNITQYCSTAPHCAAKFRERTTIRNNPLPDRFTTSVYRLKVNRSHQQVLPNWSEKLALVNVGSAEFFHVKELKGQCIMSPSLLKPKEH